MVLTLGNRLLLAACPLAGIIGTAPALAESVSKTAPLVSESIEGYAPEGLAVAGFQLRPEFEYIIFADDNVYASPSAERSDAVSTIGGKLEAQRKMGAVDLTFGAKAAVRRFASLTSEDSESASTFIRLGWQPRQTQRLTLLGGWNRAVEERGDPEALQLTSTGPRLTNIWEMQSRYAQESGRMLYTADVAWRKYDVLGPTNAQRDFTSYAGSLTIGRAISSRLYGTLTGFTTFRDFNLPVRSTGLSQSETTIGGRVGVATRERGIIEGRAQIGLFRLNPADPTKKGRSGLSADISLTLRPQRRTAITLDVFSGEIATFKLGAAARADTNIALGVQQEIRHNLYGTLGLAIRRAQYLGTTDVEKTIGPRAEVEWLTSKILSLSAYAAFNHRTSNIVEENFDRFRAGISLRLRY
jgi:hypothetical protein